MSQPAGVLALQGDFAAHAAMLSQLGAEPRLIRGPAQLDGIGALCLPGGESTTMSLLLEQTGLRQPLISMIQGGLPVLATCAGVILLARELRRDDGSLPVKYLGLLDAVVDRNAYGRQVDSFEADVRIDWAVLGQRAAPSDFHAVFIRAPRFAELGPGVVIAAEHAGEAVLVRQGNIFACAFHPELTSDTRIHAALLDLGGGK